MLDVKGLFLALRYWLYPTVRNSQDYGYYLIDELDELELPEKAKKYFDYKAYGRDAVAEDKGTFTDYGYIYNNKNEFAVWYERGDVPQQYRLTPDPQIMEDRPLADMPAPPVPVRPLEPTATDTAGRVREITAQLEQGVKDFFDSERYQEYLKAMSKFHDYSLNNTLLIVMQKPDAFQIRSGVKTTRDAAATSRLLRPAVLFLLFVTVSNPFFEGGKENIQAGYFPRREALLWAAFLPSKR